MVPTTAALQKIGLVLATIGTLSKSVFSNTACMPQEVYDVKFEYRGKCSMTVFWTTPDQQCAYGVAHYIVQSAQGCPSSWKSHGPLMGNVTSLSIEDVALITSCLLGKCYIRVIAEFDRPDQSERISSYCIALGDGFHVSPNTSTRYYNNIIGQQVCLPVRMQCGFSLIPIFVINQRWISLSGTPTSSMDEYYLRVHGGLELCISNNSDPNIVVHEICHIDPNCPLCPHDPGELVFISRTEIQSVISNATISENGSNGAMTSEQFDCLPSIVTFCASSYTVNINDDKSVSTVEVCICLPLHGLHGPSSEEIFVELSLQDNFTFPGSDVLNGSVDAVVSLNPNSTQPQCIEVELPVQDIQYADNNTSFNICLMLQLSDSVKCVHISEPCTGIKFTNRGDATTTSGSTTHVHVQGGDNTTTIIVGVIVPVVIIGIIIIALNIIAIIICKMRKRCSSFSPKPIKTEIQMKQR